MRDLLIKASRDHFKAHIEKHRVNVEILLNNPVGVAEHPDTMETIENELAQMADYQDKLDMIDQYFGTTQEQLNG